MKVMTCVAALAIFSTLMACTDRSSGPESEESPQSQSAAEVDISDSGPFLKGISKISIIGDSLTEGYGVEAAKSFPKVLEELCHEGGRSDIEVQSSGSSGSTSASGPSRVAWALRSQPDLIIIALGANDGLRGLEVSKMKENLQRTVQAAKEAGVKVVLAGMKAPPNLGRDYTQSYESVFPEVAREESVPLFPFLLEGVAGEREMNIDDGIHPNEAGHKLMGANLFKFLSEQEF